MPRIRIAWNIDLKRRFESPFSFLSIGDEDGVLDKKQIATYAKKDTAPRKRGEFRLSEPVTPDPCVGGAPSHEALKTAP